MCVWRPHDHVQYYYRDPNDQGGPWAFCLNFNPELSLEYYADEDEWLPYLQGADVMGASAKASEGFASADKVVTDMREEVLNRAKKLREGYLSRFDGLINRGKGVRGSANGVCAGARKAEDGAIVDRDGGAPFFPDSLTRSLQAQASSQNLNMSHILAELCCELQASILTIPAILEMTANDQVRLIIRSIHSVRDWNRLSRQRRRLQQRGQLVAALNPGSENGKSPKENLEVLHLYPQMGRYYDGRWTIVRLDNVGDGTVKGTMDVAPAETGRTPIRDLPLHCRSTVDINGIHLDIILTPLLALREDGQWIRTQHTEIWRSLLVERSQYIENVGAAVHGISASLMEQCGRERDGQAQSEGFGALIADLRGLNDGSVTADIMLRAMMRAKEVYDVELDKVLEGIQENGVAPLDCNSCKACGVSQGEYCRW